MTAVPSLPAPPLPGGVSAPGVPGANRQMFDATGETAPESTASGTAIPEPTGRIVLDADAIGRAVRRMAHEIVERNHGATDVVLVGMLKGGVWLADAIGQALAALEENVSVGSLDVSFYRDDLGLREVTPAASNLDFAIDDRVVVLVDDVLFTGRTVRAALDALRAYGRPKSVQLAVMVDRGHRELPIRPDYVGKNLPTSRTERVRATAEGVVIA
jgi:pyrimidine operon attenuation protein / uracil phosphoribosyltransferase